jgi:FMN phosphatase YigB (HAD superfamily)
MMDKMGLLNVFDKTYASAHLGHKKPDKEFFSKIFEELVNVQKKRNTFC